MKRMMTTVDEDKICELIERQQKNQLLRPVAILVVGMDSRESDEMFGRIAEREKMESVDFFEMKNEYSALGETELFDAWKHKIKDLVAMRKNVIVRRNFCCSPVERKLAVGALKMGNPQTYIMAIKLPTAFTSGVNYFRTKYGKGLISSEYDTIQDSIEHGNFDLDEGIDCLITEVKLH